MTVVETASHNRSKEEVVVVLGLVSFKDERSQMFSPNGLFPTNRVCSDFLRTSDSCLDLRAHTVDIKVGIEVM